MLKNYLTVALRSAQRQKVYTAINVVGLAAGTAVSILMLLFAHNVLTFDAFHSRADDLYFLYRTRPTPEGPTPINDTWYPLLDEARAMYPAIDGGARFLTLSRWVEHGQNRTLDGVAFTDPTFFQVFDGFRLLQGDVKTVLAQPNSIVLTRSKARALFGDENPLGQPLTLNGDAAHVVTGIMDDPPANSTIDMEIVAPLESLPFVHETAWEQSYLFTFVRLREDADRRQLEVQFPALVDRFFHESERGDLKLMPLTDFNDYLTGTRSYAYVLVLIGFGILLIACINFTNLATARSMLRTREIGIRKVLGAARPRLIAQFLSDAMLMSLAGLAGGCALAYLMLEPFNEFVEMELSFGLAQHPERLAALAALGVLTGLLAGSYPALYLSRLSPIETLKDHKSRDRLGVRNGLVTVQFSLAVILLVGVGVMYLQISYLKDRDLRFAEDNLMVVPLNANDLSDAQTAGAHLESFKQSVSSLAAVESIAASSGVPSQYGGNFMLFKPEGQMDRDPLDWQIVQVDDRYFNTYGIEFLEGRDFSEQDGANRAVIINETALRTIGWSSGVGKRLLPPSGGEGRTIVGVVKDFHYQAASSPIRPVVHIYGGAVDDAYAFISLRLKPGFTEAGIAGIQDVWRGISPRELTYFFVDDVFDELYQTQEDTATIVSYAAVITLLIACLGLLGLAAFTVVQRMREIAVRKVLGADEPSVILLFAKQFAKPVALSVLLATPVAYYLASLWLSDFPYRIHLSEHPALFIAVGGLVIIIALTTVALQTWRFARMNPATVLRSE